MTDFPWPDHPDLTPERLTIVAEFIVRGRNDALDRFDPAIGDDAWTLGCRAYRFGRFRIEEAVDSKDYYWLTVLDSSMQFIFRIGTVPVRFFRGNYDEPTERTLRVSFPELRQLSLLPLFGETVDELTCFRFAVETHDDGEIDRIYFVELQGSSVKTFWEIPFVPPPRILYAVEERRDEGVELPRPPVSKHDAQGDAKDKVENDKNSKTD